jgi:hypothetical protein
MVAAPAAGEVGCLRETGSRQLREASVAIAFPAYHTERFRTAAAPEDLRDLILDTIASLGWPLRQDSEEAIVAAVRFNLWSFGERIEIRTHQDGSVTITSQCAMPTQCFDWGKNESNVAMFVAELRKNAAFSVLGDPIQAREVTNHRDPGSQDIQESRNRIK